MSEKQIFALLRQLWKDVYTPEFYWVLLLLVLVLSLSWWLARCLKNCLPEQAPEEEQSRMRVFGEGGLQRLSYPLFAMILVFSMNKLLAYLGWKCLSLLSLAGTLLLAWTLVRLLVYVLRCVFFRSALLRMFERFITIAVLFWVILDMSGSADPLIEALQKVVFVVGRQKLDLWTILHGTATVCFTLLIALWIASLIEHRLTKTEQIDANMREVLARLAKALLLTVALLFSLPLVGIDVTTLSVFSGALAVGLGFGLQKIASNYVSGFIILLDRSIRLGNLIAIDDTITGTVTQISTRYTVLRTLTGIEHIIPNEYLVGNIVRNLSFTDTQLRVPISLRVSFDSDLDKVMPLLVELGRQHPRVVADPAPFAMVTGFSDHGVNIDLGVWVADPEKGTGDVRSDISRSILKAFREHGIEIPYPHREVRMIPS
jgi:small-conductance mechanosensitive channel